MTPANPQKITAHHLRRNAYLYIRQSTLRQVLEHSESTARQYALRERALALGWPLERIAIIDSDQGQSGASAADREGFQHLVAEVGLGRAGVVMGLEVSRLARNNSDWHRLLEICALTDTLILDEDGLYDPTHFNDRLILGMKGVMSEAELHVLHARLRGGVLNKASRGELKMGLPVGFVYDGADRVILDPDQQVQSSLRLFFETFGRGGSAMGVVKAFRSQGLLFPRRIRRGVHKGDLHWGTLEHSRTLRILHNPRYAGAFAYGRTRQRKQANKLCVEKLPRDQWHTLLPKAHPGYISWQQFEGNQRRLLANAQALGGDRRKSPPREGPALLQGLVLCGRCGKRMTVRYHQRQGKAIPDYLCQREGIEQGRPVCQHINGAAIDAAISALLLECVTPLALKVALKVQEELKARAEEVDALRRQQVERARYEAELAQRRYLHVDPANRLVADSLEADWNEKLRALAEAQEGYERQRQSNRLLIDEQQRAEILALATDFPRLWQHPETGDRERKRMVRLILDDVTLQKAEHITLQVRFKGGATRTLTLPLPQNATELRKTAPAVVAQIDQLLDDHLESEIAAMLNERGFLSGEGHPFDFLKVQRVRRGYGLKSRFERLRARGLLTLNDISALLGVHHTTVKKWHAHGLLQGYPVNEKNVCLYAVPDTLTLKVPGAKLAIRRPCATLTADATNEVQYEA